METVEIDGRSFTKEQWWAVSQALPGPITRAKFDAAWEDSMRHKRLIAERLKGMYRMFPPHHILHRIV